MQLNVGKRLENVKFDCRIQNAISGNVDQTLKLLEICLFVLKFALNLFCFEPNLLKHGILVQGIIIPNLVNEHEIIVLEK